MASRIRVQAGTFPLQAGNTQCGRCLQRIKRGTPKIRIVFCPTIVKHYHVKCALRLAALIVSTVKEWRKDRNG